MGDDVDMNFLRKVERHGETLNELMAERERQLANAPRMPSVLQEIVTEHHLKRDEAAIEKRLREAALTRQGRATASGRRSSCPAPAARPRLTPRHARRAPRAMSPKK